MPEPQKPMFGPERPAHLQNPMVAGSVVESSQNVQLQQPMEVKNTGSEGMRVLIRCVSEMKNFRST